MSGDAYPVQQEPAGEVVDCTARAGPADRSPEMAQIDREQWCIDPGASNLQKFRDGISRWIVKDETVGATWCGRWRIHVDLPERCHWHLDETVHDGIQRTKWPQQCFCFGGRCRNCAIDANERFSSQYVGQFWHVG